MTIHKATDGKGTWYGSLDGESFVLFRGEPKPGDEKFIRANLGTQDIPTRAGTKKGGAKLSERLAQMRPIPVTRAELIKRGFRIRTAEK